MPPLRLHWALGGCVVRSYGILTRRMSMLIANYFPSFLFITDLESVPFSSLLLVSIQTKNFELIETSMALR
jgi:hypothetical protein